MPTAGKGRRHVIVNTRCSWLTGDIRGFRNRRHRIHSSGDYRNPPPPHEHERLRRYFQKRSGKPIALRRSLRKRVATAFLSRLQKETHRVLVIAVSRFHVHALVEMPDDRALIRAIIGRCKRCACEAIKHELSGSIWAAGGEFKRIMDRSHHLNAYRYIRDDQGPGAWVWTFRDGELGFRGKRKVPRA